MTQFVKLAVLAGWFFSHGAQGLDLVPQLLRVNGSSVTLSVPSGTRVEFLASIPGARFLAVGPDNELIAGSNGASVYRLLPPYRSAQTLVSIGTRSHSAVIRGGKLYVADSAGLYEADYAGPSTLLQPASMTRILTFPTGGHSSRSVIVGADNSLYIGIGISGNCSDEYIAGTSPDYSFNLRRGGVWRVDESGPTPLLTPFSSGLRNPIGLAVNPENGELWTTNAGSDDLGYNQPREIFSRLHQDSWHGMPWFQYIDSSFQRQGCIGSSPPRPASEATPPSVTFDARSTPMGIAFVQNNQLSNAFNGNALVAIHGSWASNGGPGTRRPPKIAMVRFQGNDPIGVEDAVSGFQRADGSRFARPSGAIIGPDGNFYFSSDGGEVQGLFRLVKTPPASSPPPPSPDTSAAVIAPSVSLLLGD